MGYFWGVRLSRSPAVVSMLTTLFLCSLRE